MIAKVGSKGDDYDENVQHEICTCRLVEKMIVQVGNQRDDGSE